MEIERKVSMEQRKAPAGKPPRKRGRGTLRRHDSGAARRRAARQKAAAAAQPEDPETLGGLVGKGIKVLATSLDLRRKFLRSVGSQYLERIRTARSSYFEDHADSTGSGMSRQPSLAELQIVGLQVSVKTRRAATPKPPAAELEDITDKLKTRALEVEAVLRRDFTTSIEAVEGTRRALERGLTFLNELGSLAKSAGVLSGAVFQELLARHAAGVSAAVAAPPAPETDDTMTGGGGGADVAGESPADAVGALVVAGSAARPAYTNEGSSATRNGGGGGGSSGSTGGGGGASAGGSAGGGVDGDGSGTTGRGGATAGLESGFRSMHLHRERGAGRVPLESVTDGVTIDRMVATAAELQGLVRIKLEDDNDLGLAATVLEDSSGFFTDVVELAKWREMDVMELLEELRQF